jgi:hypothetical protein
MQLLQLLQLLQQQRFEVLNQNYRSRIFQQHNLNGFTHSRASSTFMCIDLLSAHRALLEVGEERQTLG